MVKLEINELRRVLNQTSTLLDAAVADADLEERLKEIRERVRDEQDYLAGLSRLRLSAAGKAY